MVDPAQGDPASAPASPNNQVILIDSSKSARVMTTAPSGALRIEAPVNGVQENASGQTILMTDPKSAVVVPPPATKPATSPATAPATAPGTASGK